jgi:ataxia telangiectasia mutated family protein
MCREHPFHSLYQLYCLLPERSLTDSSRRTSGHLKTPTLPPTQTERGSAAHMVFERLRADETVGEKVAQVEMLCNACWQWAKHPLEKRRYTDTKKSYVIPSELLICRIRDLQVPVPTAPTPLDPTMRYDNCNWIQSFEKLFQTAGGINLPKITVCIDSGNNRFKLLVCRVLSSYPSLLLNFFNIVQR